MESIYLTNKRREARLAADGVMKLGVDSTEKCPYKSAA